MNTRRKRKVLKTFQFMCPEPGNLTCEHLHQQPPQGPVSVRTDPASARPRAASILAMFTQCGGYGVQSIKPGPASQLSRWALAAWATDLTLSPTFICRTGLPPPPHPPPLCLFIFRLWVNFFSFPSPALITLSLYPSPSLSFIWSWQVACGILAPRPGIKPALKAAEARSPNHGTTRGVPYLSLFFKTFKTVISGWNPIYFSSPEFTLPGSPLW